ncbi:hypothetical protein ABS768_04895 [Flavobacterium sp. ST-75]|uniref:Uncharacterized protein n=1 Tax=Flavobacterium rhizophilum TaxID=3163296 RepID=A0ABW8YA35_9FLAO
MQDLINEEEFIKPVKYNPWKWFKRSYLIALFQACFIYSCTIFGKPENGLIMIGTLIYFICPITVPFFIVFRKKLFANTSLGTIVLGILILNLVYSSLFIMVMWLRGQYIFVDDSPMTIALGIVLFIFFCTLLTIPIIIVIRAILIKKLKKKEEKALEAHNRNFS